MAATGVRVTLSAEWLYRAVSTALRYRYGQAAVCCKGINLKSCFEEGWLLSGLTGNMQKVTREPVHAVVLQEAGHLRTMY